MNKIQLSFYDEIITYNFPSDLSALKNLIGEKYFLDPVDVNELIIYYINENDRVSISNESDYQHALSHLNKEFSNDKNYILTIYLQVSEKSRLYQREFENSKIDFLSNDEKKRNELLESLKKDIEEKEKLLKQIIEEEEENEKKEKVRLQEEKERLRLEAENELKEKERLQKEKDLVLELEKSKEKENLKESITESITDSVNKNIEKIREELLNKTLNETSKALEKSIFFCEIKKTNQTTHKGVSCNLCGVSPIIGNRYKCTVCYDFDLCEKCEQKEVQSANLPSLNEINDEEEKHVVDHPMIKYKSEFNHPVFKRPGCPFRNQNKDFNHHGRPFGHGNPWIIKRFSRQMNEMKKTYDVNHISDEKIIKALKKTNGNIPEALLLLF